jgi:hypothetical protein
MEMYWPFKRETTVYISYILTLLDLVFLNRPILS